VCHCPFWEDGIPKYLRTTSRTRSKHLRKTEIVEVCNLAVGMVPSIDEKMGLPNDTIYSEAAKGGDRAARLTENYSKSVRTSSRRK